MPSFISSDVAEDMILFAKQLFDQKKKRRYFNRGSQHGLFPTKTLIASNVIFVFTKAGLVKCKKRECINYSAKGAFDHTLVLSAYTSSLILKSDSNLPKKFCYLLHWKPFKNDEECFLFHLKSSFRSQDI